MNNAINIDMLTFLSDIFFTIWEGIISVILLKTYTTKKISLKTDVLWIFLFVLLVETMTFFSVSSTLKVLLEYFLFPLIVWTIYKINIRKCYLSISLFTFICILSELIIVTITGLFDTSSLGFYFSIEIGVINHILITALAVFMGTVLKKLANIFTKREDLLLGIFLFALILLLLSFVNRSIFGWELMTQLAQIIGIIILLVALVLLIHFVHDSVKTRLIQQEEERSLEKMKVQYQYYEERLKDEQRVREIYHDMKNHLLVLQAQLKESGNTDNQRKSQETEKMISKLQNEVSAYGNYIQTGNAFLDVILKDKMAQAKKKQIDFLAEIDFSKGGFIEGLDISTIFGNAFDNAIEACIKLPEEERMITVKTGVRNHFFLILIENSAKDFSETTTKEDDFLHGFGKKNIQKSVEKYQGSCQWNYENGIFSLSILFPLQDI